MAVDRKGEARVARDRNQAESIANVTQYIKNGPDTEQSRHSPLSAFNVHNSEGNVGRATGICALAVDQGGVEGTVKVITADTSDGFIGLTELGEHSSKDSGTNPQE